MSKTREHHRCYKLNIYKVFSHCSLNHNSFICLDLPSNFEINILLFDTGSNRGEKNLIQKKRTHRSIYQRLSNVGVANLSRGFRIHSLRCKTAKIANIAIESMLTLCCRRGASGAPTPYVLAHNLFFRCGFLREMLSGIPTLRYKFKNNDVQINFQQYLV